MRLSKNQKRKFERYGIVPTPLRSISDQGSLVFIQSFKDEIRTTKKRIYRKPYYRYQNVFETTSPQYLRVDLIRLRKMLSQGSTKQQCAETFDLSTMAITKAIKMLDELESSAS